MEKLLSFASPFEEKIPLTYKANPCGYIQLRITVTPVSMMTGQNQGVQQGVFGQQQPSYAQ